MPLWGQPGSGRYSQVRSALARAAGRGQLVPSITHSGRPSTTAESANVRVNSVRSRCHVDRPIRERVAGTRPEMTERGRQAEPYQRAPVGRRQDCIHQLEQAILTEAQAVVELLTEADKRRQFFGFEHTPSLTRFSQTGRPSDPLGPFLIQT